MIALPIYFFILIELAFVTHTDVKYKKISNLWSLLNIGIAAVLFILFPEMYLLELDSFQYSVVFIIVGFALYLLNIMGGGDSKYLASLFLIIPSSLQDQAFYFLLISTIVVGTIFFARNVFEKREKLIIALRNKDVVGVKSCFGTKFAFAPVILLTWMFLGIKIINHLLELSKTP